VRTGWGVCAFFIWIIVLCLGRMPQSLARATAAALRFEYRLDAYLYLLTSAYPKRLLGDQQGRDFDPSWGVASATRPLVLTGGEQGLLVLFIVLGVLGDVGSGFLDHNDSNSMSNSSGSTFTRVHDAGPSPHARHSPLARGRRAPGRAHDRLCAPPRARAAPLYPWRRAQLKRLAVPTAHDRIGPYLSLPKTSSTQVSRRSSLRSPRRLRHDRLPCGVCPEREGESDVGGLFGAVLHGR
jgi:hypothetical protein